MCPRGGARTPIASFTYGCPLIKMLSIKIGCRLPKFTEIGFVFPVAAHYGSPIAVAKTVPRFIVLNSPFRRFANR